MIVTFPKVSRESNNTMQKLIDASHLATCYFATFVNEKQIENKFHEGVEA